MHAAGLLGVEIGGSEDNDQVGCRRSAGVIQIDLQVKLVPRLNRVLPGTIGGDHHHRAGVHRGLRRVGEGGCGRNGSDGCGCGRGGWFLRPHQAGGAGCHRKDQDDNQGEDQAGFHWGTLSP